jgi:outer membrane lipoprotein-sorting protein
MNKRRLWGSLSVVLGFLLVSSAQTQEGPKTMMKISTRMVEPKPEPGSFAAQARTLWRAGTRYGRVAEAPDAQNRIQGLMIINEPDVWMINLFNKSGKHIVDPGPSLDVHLPIFPDTNVSTKLKDLEFGMELGFFSKKGAQRSEGEAINGTATERYEVTIENSKIVLWADMKSKKPLRVSLVEGGQTEIIEYLSYDDELAFDPSLFQPPAGIAMQNSK